MNQVKIFHSQKATNNTISRLPHTGILISIPWMEQTAHMEVRKSHKQTEQREKASIRQLQVYISV